MMSSPAPTLVLAASARTTQGARPLNEDRVVGDVPRGIFAVVDGSGGPGKGDFAADVVQGCLRSATGPQLALANAHRRLVEAVGQVPDRHGLGASAVVVAVTGNHATICHVGDAQVYHVRAGVVRPLVPADGGDRLGRGPTELPIGCQTLELEPEDALVLASNGLARTLPPERMLGAPRKSPALDAWLAGLLESALAAGSQDNISAVVVRALADDAASARVPAVGPPPAALNALAAMAALEPSQGEDIETLLDLLEDPRPERVLATRLEPAIAAAIASTGATEAMLVSVEAGRKAVLAAITEALQPELPGTWGVLVDNALATGGAARNGEVAVIALPVPPDAPPERVRLALCLAPPPATIPMAAVTTLAARADVIAAHARVLSLRDEAQRHVRRFAMLNHVGKVVASSLDLDQVLRMLLEQTLALTGAMHAYVVMPTSEGLASRYGLDWNGNRLEGLEISQSLAKQVLESRKPVCLMDAGRDATQRTTSMRALDIQSVMCVPLVGNDRVIGLLYVSTRAIGKPFTESDLEFLGAIANQTALSVQHAVYVAQLEEKQRLAAELDRIGQEMDIARRIQTALLPTDLAIDGFDLAMTVVSAAEVGGDLIDYLPQPDGRFWLAIGDATGHGLTPGLVMMMAESVLSGLTAAVPDGTPGQLIAHLNTVLYRNVQERLRNDTFMTLQVLRHMGAGRFVAAGLHCDMLVFRAAAGQVERLESTGFWTGYLPDVADLNAETSFTLAPGDVLLLFSDGVVEARNAHGTQYEVDRLAWTLQHHGRGTATAIRDAVLADVQRWVARQDDDLSLIVLRRDPDPRPPDVP